MCQKKDRLAEAVLWRLSERAGARDGAAAVVEPVSRDMPGWRGVHENPRSCVSDPATICSWAERVRDIGWLGVLLDDFVAPDEDGLRDSEAQRFGGLQVNDEIKICGLFHRKIGGLRALEDLVDEDCGSFVHCAEVGTVGHETADVDGLSSLIYRG